MIFWFKAIFSTLLVLLHAENMLFHNVHLHSEESDQSGDKFFDAIKIKIAVFFIIAAHAWFAWRFVQSDLYSVVFWVGVAIFTFGYTLRTWAYRILGRLFTFEIGIREGHSIIQEGPYKFIRHPSYTGYTLMILGIGLSLHSFIYLGIGLGTCLVFFVIRIWNEEKMLAEHFGDDWQEYKKGTSALIPFIF